MTDVEDDGPAILLSTSHLASARRSFDRIQMVLAHRVTLMGGIPDQTTALQGALIALTVQHTALLSLLIDRGVCTADEYHAALAQQAADAAAQYTGERGSETPH